MNLFKLFIISNFFLSASFAQIFEQNVSQKILLLKNNNGLDRECTFYIAGSHIEKINFEGTTYKTTLLNEDLSPGLSIYKLTDGAFIKNIAIYDKTNEIYGLLLESFDFVLNHITYNKDGQISFYYYNPDDTLDIAFKVSDYNIGSNKKLYPEHVNLTHISKNDSKNDIELFLHEENIISFKKDNDICNIKYIDKLEKTDKTNSFWNIYEVIKNDNVVGLLIIDFENVSGFKFVEIPEYFYLNRPIYVGVTIIKTIEESKSFYYKISLNKIEIFMRDVSIIKDNGDLKIDYDITDEYITISLNSNLDIKKYY